MFSKKKNNQKGYTLLEYAAGAALLISLLYAGINVMGNGIETLLSGIGNWASEQTTRLP